MKEKAKQYFLDNYSVGAGGIAVGITASPGAPGISTLGPGFGAKTNRGLKPLNKDHHEQAIKRAKEWLSKNNK